MEIVDMLKLIELTKNQPNLGHQLLALRYYPSFQIPNFLQPILHHYHWVILDLWKNILAVQILMHDTLNEV